MAKFADDVRTWHFDDTAEGELCMDPVWVDNDVVPAFICARLMTDGYVVRPHVGKSYIRVRAG